MKEILSRPIKKVPTLRGKTIVTLFYEPSTRTRVSFEQAAKNLSADVVNLNAAASSATVSNVNRNSFRFIFSPLRRDMDISLIIHTEFAKCLQK